MDENKTKKSTIVLKFKKRRYDGGTEIELIQNIERQKAAQFADLKKKQAEELMHKIEATSDQPGRLMTESVHGAAEPVVQPATPEVPRSKARRVMEAFALGPLEMLVGSLGIVTAGFAILTFRYMNNKTLEAQSTAVLEDCWKAIGRGLAHALTAPGRALTELRA